MITRVLRKIIRIDEEKCNGRGACVPACAGGGLQIIDGKAKLVSETYYDGLGACLGECPQGATTIYQQSMLGHWPLQLTLVPPTAPFLQGADLVLVADCVPFTYAGFHQDFIKDHAVLVVCPKLDDFQAHLKKLVDILSHSSVRSLTVVHMEVPCCAGLTYMVNQAMQLAGKDIPLKQVTVGIRGDLKPQ